MDTCQAPSNLQLTFPVLATLFFSFLIFSQFSNSLLYILHRATDDKVIKSTEYR